MKKLLYSIPILSLLFCLACEETTIADLNEQSVLVYNNSLSTMPVVKDDGFYFLSNNSSALNLCYIDSEGDLTEVAAINNFLPDDFTSNTFETTQCLLLSDNSIIVAVSYLADTEETNYVNYTLVKFDELMELSWSVSDTLPFLAMQGSLQSVILNGDGNITMLASYIEQIGQTSSSYIMQKTYAYDSGSFTSLETLKWNDKIIVGIYPSQEQGYYVFSSEQGGPPSDITDVSSGSTINKVENSVVGEAIEVPVVINTIYSVHENHDVLIISGNSSEINAGTTPLLMFINPITNTSWYYDLTMNENIYITSISASSNGYYISGSIYNGDAFDWTNLSVLRNSIMFVAEIDFAGVVIWEMPQVVEESIGVGVFKNSDNSLRILAMQSAFSTLSNITLYKTSETGEIQ